MTRHEYRHGHGHTRWTRWDPCAFGHPLLLAERLLDQDSNEQENGDNNDQRRCHNTRSQSCRLPISIRSSSNDYGRIGFRKTQVWGELKSKSHSQRNPAAFLNQSPLPFHLYETLPRPTNLPSTGRTSLSGKPTPHPALVYYPKTTPTPRDTHTHRMHIARSPWSTVHIQ